MDKDILIRWYAMALETDSLATELKHKALQLKGEIVAELIATCPEHEQRIIVQEIIDAARAMHDRALLERERRRELDA